MDESYRKAVGFVVEQINPMLARSCPLSDLAHSIFSSVQEIRTPVLDRFVMYSRAPPAMMHINRLLFYAGRMNSSQTAEFGGVRFIQFFAPQSLDTTKLTKGGNIFDLSMYEGYLSHEKDGRVDDILRESLLQAAEKLKERFSSLSPSPYDLLLQSYLGQDDPQSFDIGKPLDEASTDAGFSSAIKAALFELKKTGHEKSDLQLQLLELLIAEASKSDSAVKMAIGERIVLSTVPHPERSAGSDALSIGLYRAIMRVKSDLCENFPVETIIAAIERLPADKEVKLLLQSAIVGMIEKAQEAGPKGFMGPSGFIRPRGLNISMKVKFKIPRSSSGRDEPQPQRPVETSPSFFRSFVNVFK